MSSMHETALNVFIDALLEGPVYSHPDLCVALYEYLRLRGDERAAAVAPPPELEVELPVILTHRGPNPLIERIRAAART